MSIPASFRAPARAFSLAATFLAAAATPPPAAAVTITVNNADAFLEGFNDPAARSPVGGNPGTTLGAQRLFVYQYAAEAWSLRLGGNVPVVVKARFDGLGGSSNSAVLGYARPTTVERDFPGAPRSQTWYVSALVNQLAGTDRNNASTASCNADDLVGGKCAEISSVFNGDVDNQTVLGAVDFYYGIDGNAGGDVDFLSVVLHEIAHGLGFLDLIDPVSGKISPDPDFDTCLSCSDAYSDRLHVTGFTPPWVSDMTPNQRLLAIESGAKLGWNTAGVKAAAEALSEGVRADGALRMFAPDPYQPGSSIAHVDVTAAPNELMEPYITAPPHAVDVTLAIFEDLGWDLLHLAACGDPTDDGKITTGDALAVLKGAVGSFDCPGHACDANGLVGLTTSDALVVLKKAVGQAVALSCPLV